MTRRVWLAVWTLFWLPIVALLFWAAKRAENRARAEGGGFHDFELAGLGEALLGFLFCLVWFFGGVMYLIRRSVKDGTDVRASEKQRRAAIAQAAYWQEHRLNVGDKVEVANGTEATPRGLRGTVTRADDKGEWVYVEFQEKSGSYLFRPDRLLQVRGGERDSG
jgi:hypothetical protein